MPVACSAGGTENNWITSEGLKRMHNLNLADYIVIACYALLMIGIAIAFMRVNRGAVDFFSGGSRIPWLVAGLSAFMSGFSAWTFTGMAGVAYRSGICAIAMYIGNAMGFLLGFFIFAQRWRRSRVTTVMQYLNSRFNETTRQTFSWATIIFQLFMNASMLYGLSLFVSSICKLPITWTVVVAGAIITFSCLAGGLWAVVITSFVQASLLIPFSIVLAVLSLARLGGVSGLYHALPADLTSLRMPGEFSWLYILSFAVMTSFGYNSSAMAQRYFSVEDESAGRKVALLCCGLFFAAAFMWFIPPMAMRAIYPDLHAVRPLLANPSEAAYAIASLTLLPNGLIGVMLAVVFSSTMANLSSTYNLKAAVLSKDVYQAMFRPKAGERELLFVGRLATLVLGSATLGIAVYMAASGVSVFSAMLTFNTIISLAYGPPALLGLVVKQTPPWSGLASFTVGIVLGCAGAFVLHWTLIQQVLIIVPSSFSVFFLSRLWDKTNPKRDLLFLQLHTPIDVATELHGSSDMSTPVFRFLSRVIFFIGLLSLLLAFQTRPSERRTVFWFAGTTIAVSIGLSFVRGSEAVKATS